MMKLTSPDSLFWLVILLFFFRPSTAQAHDPGLSSATIVLGDSRVEVVVGLAIKDAESLCSNNGNPVILRTSDEFGLIKAQLEAVTASEFQLRFDDVIARPEQVIANLKDSQNIDVLLTFRRTGAARLCLVSSLFEKLPFGHREFVSVQLANRTTLTEAMLSTKDNSLEVDLPTGPLPATSADRSRIDGSTGARGWSGMRCIRGNARTRAHHTSRP